jgi:hypothetical protein
MREEEKLEKSQGSWSILGLLKKLIGLMIALTLAKTILFPTQTSDLDKFDDIKNIKFN